MQIVVLRKCKFAEPSVKYLGYTISSGRINPGEEKTAAVKNFAPPQTVKEICCFTGLCNYFCQFIRGYAGIAGKLTELTALKGHEKNYSAFLLEMAGAAQAIEAFHHYLYGVTFTLMCDHKLMERLGTVHKRTLIRLQELMGQNNFVIKYLPGKMNELADTHSRTANVCAVTLVSGDDTSRSSPKRASSTESTRRSGRRNNGKTVSARPLGVSA